MDIVNVVTQQVVQSFILSSGNTIYDIAKLATANRYVLGFSNGVQTVEIEELRTASNFQS